MAKEINSNSGLSDEQVGQSRKRCGLNVLTPPRRISLWKLYLDKYRDPIIQILLVAALISLVLAFIEHNFMETTGIFVAVFWPQRWASISSGMLPRSFISLQP